MTEISVWAPAAKTVHLVLEDTTLPMARSSGGWWWYDVKGATHGSPYAFSVDGATARPDPRSRWQPNGVHGPSAIVDHARFPWTDEGWRGISHRGAILYELHVGTYTTSGTFEAIIDRLPHLVDLGIDAIELLPVAEFDGERGWGYDGVDIYAPHHIYGGPEGLKRLVDACHNHGLGVVLDVVYNHFGPSGNYLSQFGPYFSDSHETNWGAAVNFDGSGSDEVRRFVLDNALMWLRDYHMDGLRIDAVHAIVDDSDLHILEEMAAEVDALAARVGRPLFLIAESDLNDPKFVQSRDAGGYGLDSAWADEWHHALHAVLTDEREGYYEDFGSIGHLAKALRQAWVYDGTYSPHRERHHGKPLSEGLTGHQFVVCAQNHDQVGNRARGERLSHIVGMRRSKVAAALLLTSPFTPMLFQGEEWASASPFQYFTDHQEPELAEAVSRGRREEFAHFDWDPREIPDPQDELTFERSQIDWEEVDRPPHAGMLDWYRRLIALRREMPDLADPRLSHIEVHADPESMTIDVRRGSSRVLVNLGAEAREFRISGITKVHLASDPSVRLAESGVVVPGDAVAVVGHSAHG